MEEGGGTLSYHIIQHNSSVNDKDKTAVMDSYDDNAVDFRIISFVSDADFEYLAAARNVAEEAIDWSDLPINIVYRIHAVLPIQTKSGARVILKLRNREGEDIKVWTPANVSKDVKSGIKLNGTDAYIKSLGQKETRTSAGSKRRYFDFQTVFI